MHAVLKAILQWFAWRDALPVNLSIILTLQKRIARIANRMIHEGAPLRVCQETIYRSIYAKEGQRDDLWWNLSTHCVVRRHCRTRRDKEPKFHREVSILFRPDDVAHHRQFGHWEAGLMLFE